jgi:hypothetical protein
MVGHSIRAEFPSLPTKLLVGGFVSFWPLFSVYRGAYVGVVGFRRQNFSMSALAAFVDFSSSLLFLLQIFFRTMWQINNISLDSVVVRAVKGALWILWPTGGLRNLPIRQLIQVIKVFRLFYYPTFTSFFFFFFVSAAQVYELIWHNQTCNYCV